MTFKEFVEKHGITISNKRTDRNPFMPSMNGQQMNHWKCTLKRGKKRMTITFSQGLGIKHEPHIHDVLLCMVADADSLNSAGCYEEWCREFGYEIDEQQSKKIYNACIKEKEKMEKFLTDEQFEELLRCEEE